MLNLRKRSIYSKHKVPFIWAGIVVQVMILAALVVLAVVVFGSVYLKATEHPKFCGSFCHNMNASYESYKKSPHSGIYCAECHTREGFVDGFLEDTLYAAGREVYVHMEGEQFYDMDDVRPKVYDEGCLRPECHKAGTLAEKKNLFAKGVVFDHSGHLSATSVQEHVGGPATAETPDSLPELNCVSCHSRSEEKHMDVDRRACILCHFRPEADESAMQDCRSCHLVSPPDHDEYMADVESCNDCHGMKAGEIAVSPEKCAQCHEAGRESLSAGKAHELHVDKQEARCMDCHEPIAHELGF